MFLKKALIVERLIETPIFIFFPFGRLSVSWENHAVTTK